MILDKIEFEMEVGGYVRGTITIGLFTDIVPKTVKNFIKLSTSDHFPSYKENGFTSEFTGPASSIPASPDQYRSDLDLKHSNKPTRRLLPNLIPVSFQFHSTKNKIHLKEYNSSSCFKLHGAIW